MIKVRKKILISLLLVISIFAVGLKSFAGIEITKNYADAEGITFKGETIDEVVEELNEEGSSWWYNLSISDMMGSRLKLGGADYKKKSIYCIDPHTPAKDKDYYKLVNIIDINNVDDVNVYALSGNGKKVVKYSATGSDRRGVLDFSYLAFKSIANKETDTKLNTTKGAYKISMTYNMWGNWDRFKNLGIPDDFYLKIKGDFPPLPTD